MKTKMEALQAWVEETTNSACASIHDFIRMRDPKAPSNIGLWVRGNTGGVQLEPKVKEERWREAACALNFDEYGHGDTTAATEAARVILEDAAHSGWIGVFRDLRKSHTPILGELSHVAFMDGVCLRGTLRYQRWPETTARAALPYTFSFDYVMVSA